MKKLYIASFFLLLNFFSAQKPIDINKEAKKTEIYTPIPEYVSTKENISEAPSDAIILFDGKNLEQWTAKDGKSAAKWMVENGVLTVNKGEGDIMTKEKFSNYQLHLEYKIPENITGEGQLRGNSGIFLAYLGGEADGYELQILDNYQNSTYVNGQNSSVYKQNPPLVNASKKPGEWQTYDIVWTAPTFDNQGNLKSPAVITAFLNGVLVQNHFKLKGQTLYVGKPFYKKHGSAPVMLQAHNDPSEPVSFRNIWIRPLE